MSKKIPFEIKFHKWVVENIPVELAESTLFRFNVKLQALECIEGVDKPQRRVISVDLLPDLALDYETVEDSMESLPSQFAFWAAVYSEVRLGVAVAERKLKARKAEVTRLIIKEYNDLNLKPSAEIIKTIVESDERLNEADSHYQYALMQSGKLYNMVEALKMKAELARSLLGLKKKERDTQ